MVEGKRGRKEEGKKGKDTKEHYGDYTGKGKKPWPIYVTYTISICWHFAYDCAGS